MSERRRAKKVVAGIYSFAADKLYEPIVVRRAFPLFGGDLNEVVLELGRHAVTEAAGRPILDMPVGTAYFTLDIARRHEGLVVGVDIAEGMVQRAVREARAAGALNLRGVQADAHHLPFSTGAFGAIVCANGLQVIPGLAPAVSELARVLAPAGTLFVTVVTLPVGRLLTRGGAARLPTMLRSGKDVIEALRASGLQVTRSRRRRLATIIEARKP